MAKRKASGPCKGKSLNKPFRTPGGKKKSAVCVSDGAKIKIVRFGDPNMKIKKKLKAPWIVLLKALREFLSKRSYSKRMNYLCP